MCLCVLLFWGFFFYFSLFAGHGSPESHSFRKKYTKNLKYNISVTVAVTLDKSFLYEIKQRQIHRTMRGISVNERVFVCFHGFLVLNYKNVSVSTW